jgi:hypothetical protein
MAFEDLKDQLSDRMQSLWGKLQENSSFVQLMEQYQALPPNGQKAVVAGIGALFALILFMIPWSFYSSSQDKIGEPGIADTFEGNKKIIEDLFAVRRDAGILRSAPQRMDQNQIMSLAQARVAEAGVPPERVIVAPFDNKNTGKSSPVIPKSVDQLGAAITVAKLNLTQLVDIGYALETISNGVKMIAVEAHAAANDPRYFDVTYKLASFSVPEPAAKPEGKKGAKRQAPHKPAPKEKDSGG